MPVRVSLVWSLLVLLAPAVVSAQSDDQDGFQLAVLDVKTTGVDESLGPVLTEVLSTALANNPGITVIAGSDIKAMLDFEASRALFSCEESACVAEMGGALGVDGIVITQVAKVGDTYVINLKLLNVLEARTEARISKTAQGKVDLLLEAIRQGGRQLLSKAKVKPKASGKPGSTSEDAEVSSGAQPTDDDIFRKAPGGAAKGGGIGVGPIVLFGVGVAAIGAGVAFHIKAQNAYNSASGLPVGNETVQAGQTDQLVALLGYGVGTAAIVGGALWWWLGSDDDSDSVALVPVVTDQAFGFSLVGRMSLW